MNLRWLYIETINRVTRKVICNYNIHKNHDMLIDSIQLFADIFLWKRIYNNDERFVKINATKQKNP